MKLGTFVNAYEQSLIALNREAVELQGRISRIESKQDVQPGGRLASKLAVYQHQLASLKAKHRGADCWFGTVALPIFSILEKRLGHAYLSVLSRDGDHRASLRFFHASNEFNQGLVLKMTMARLCTEPSHEEVEMMVERSVIRPDFGCVDDRLTLDTTLAEVLIPLSAA